jgi:hypothetical protein
MREGPLPNPSDKKLPKTQSWYGHCGKYNSGLSSDLINFFYATVRHNIKYIL